MLRLSWPVRLLSTSAKHCVSQVPDFQPKHLPPSKIVEDKTLPIEKKSLSRGLSLNRFEKDFMIYPEYTDTKDLNNIKEYVERLGQQLDVAYDKNAKNAASVPKVLIENEVYATFIHRAFGGMSFNHKDSLLLSEALARRDLSLFVNVDRVHMAARILEIYGNVEQREKYLPKIASGQCKPALCFIDDISDGSKETEVSAFHGHNGILDGKKINVINADSADIFFVIARTDMQRAGDRLCFIIEKKDVGDRIVVSKPKTTQGLQGTSFCDVEFKGISVGPQHIVGDAASALDIVSDSLSTNRTFQAAAVVGFLKKICEDLALFANSHIIGFKPLADTPSVQAAMSDFAMQIFLLETIAYYMGGMDDESLFLLNDVEHSIIQRIANRTLRQCVLTISEISGFAAIDSTFEYDKKIRDAVTLLSLSLPDLTLVRSISLPIIDSYIQNSRKELRFSSRIDVKHFFIEKFFTSKFKHPAAIHYIAEHAHPSLEQPCRLLEENTWRLNYTLEKICMNYGQTMKEDYFSLNALAKIIENNLGTVALISRTSRSYSVGLKNADLELAWAYIYSNRVSKESIDHMEALTQYLELVKVNPSITSIGKEVMNSKGYPLDHPLNKNW